MPASNSSASTTTKPRRKRAVSTTKKEQKPKRVKTELPTLPNPNAEQSSSPSSSNTTTSSNATAVRPSVIGVARSISACIRCRLRKTRCDQKFPSCSACKKADVECMGIDAATGREIPRSYVTHLEDRVAMLELKLQKLEKESSVVETPGSTHTFSPSHSGSNSVSTPQVAPPQVVPQSAPQIPTGEYNGFAMPQDSISKTAPSISPDTQPAQTPKNDDVATGVEGIMSSVKMVSSKAATSAPSAFLGSSSGLSFARLLLTAIKFKPNNADHTHIHPHHAPNGPNGPNGLPHFSATATAAASSASSSTNYKSKVSPASLPSKETAEKFLYLFFSQANSQLPVIHREQFLTNHFFPIYGPLSEGTSLASDYTTIGVPLTPSPAPSPAISPADSPSIIRRSKLTSGNAGYFGNNTPIIINNLNAPQVTEETPKKALYFLHLIFAIATSIHHQKHTSHISESFRVAAMQHFDAVLASPNRLEALQGILLLALYSIMRPAVPGIWYVMGWALRLCVDLGLHTEASVKHSLSVASGSVHHGPVYDPFTLDMRRRLFWCTYAIDRQVSVYLGRPFGIPEESIKVPFPSQLDDTLIVADDFSHLNDIQGDHARKAPSYKIIAISFFKIRKLQAEIRSILYDCASLPREYESLEQWRTNMGQRLEAWHASCPKSAKKMNCNFNLAFIELNYQQTRLLLYGPTPSDSPDPSETNIEIIADAGEKVIQLYQNLHRHRSVNYTWVAVHNLFMAGTSYLFALYHSPKLREITTVEQIDENAIACIEVLSALVDRCDAAASCRSTFELLTVAILKLCTQEKAASNANNPNHSSLSVPDVKLHPPSRSHTTTPGGHTYSPSHSSSEGMVPSPLHQSHFQQGSSSSTETNGPNHGQYLPIGGQSPHSNMFPMPMAPTSSPGSFDSNIVNNNHPNSTEHRRHSLLSNPNSDDLWIDNFDLDSFFLEAGVLGGPNRQNTQGLHTLNHSPQPQHHLHNHQYHQGEERRNETNQLPSIDHISQLSPQQHQHSLTHLLPHPHPHPHHQQPQHPNQAKARNQSLFLDHFPYPKMSNQNGRHPGPTSNNDYNANQQERLSQQYTQYLYGTGSPTPPNVNASNSNNNNNSFSIDGQRIFDLINEVPMAAIWDQFFAPSNANNMMMNPNGGEW